MSVPKSVQSNALLTFDSMAKHSVPPTPENYAIWYAYCTQSIPELVDVIEQRLAGGPGFTSELGEALFAEHFGHQAEVDHFRKLCGQLMEMLKNIRESIDTSEQEHTSFGSRLDEYALRLQTVDDAREIERIVSGLKSETEIVQRNSRRLREELSRSAKEMNELNRQVQAAQKDALTDPLTGLANRRCFDLRIAEAIRRTNDSGAAISLLFIDVDHFKSFNDRFGHKVGDQVLKLVGNRIKDAIEETDIAGRYGGEEFVVLLNDRGLDEARVVAEKIRITVGRKEIKKRGKGGSCGKVKVSVGVTEYQPGESVEAFIERADALLYRAKEEGRDRVCGGRAEQHTEAA